MVAIAALTACNGLTGSTPADARPDVPGSAAAVATQSPGGERSAAASVDPGVAAGTVRVQPGPFTDRIRLTGLRLRGETVHGRLDVVSDVSELLALEVRVDFYNSAGVLTGTARQVFGTEDTEQFHTTKGIVGLPFAVVAPRKGAHSVVLSVPVLVNE